MARGKNEIKEDIRCLELKMSSMRTLNRLGKCDNYSYDYPNLCTQYQKLQAELKECEK